MKSLISGLMLLILSSLAMGVGLNTAILPQKSHFKMLFFNNVRDESKWVYKPYEERINEGFLFWYVDTIKRVIRWLKTRGTSIRRLSIIV